MRDLSAVARALDEVAPPTFTVRELAERFHMKPATVKGMVWRYAAQLSPPRYCRIGSHPRKHRLLTADDARFLTMKRLQTVSMRAAAIPGRTRAAVSPALAPWRPRQRGT